MRIYNSLTVQWDETLGRYLTVSEDSYEYSGEVSWCKGPTGAENSIAASQQSLMSTLQGAYSTAFAGQQNIINGLTTSLNNTLTAGPSQYGFSPAETTALNTQATTGVAAQYQAAKQAVGEQQAAQGGGNAFVPAGETQKNNTAIANAAANTESNQLLGIQEAGFNTGRENYNTAVGGLTNVANLENPNGTASAATSAGNSAFSDASTIEQQAAAASPWSQIGGLVGSLGGAFLGGIGGGAGKAIGSNLFGSSNGTSPSSPWTS